MTASELVAKSKAFLQAVYDAGGAQRPVDTLVLRANLHIDNDLYAAVVPYLTERRLATFTYGGGDAKITAAGIDYLNPSRVEASTRAYGSVNIERSIVAFGDSSTVNIGAITVGDVLELLEKQVEASAMDPNRKEGWRKQLADFLRHPASTTIMQTTLPELLKRLPGGGSG